MGKHMFNMIPPVIIAGIILSFQPSEDTIKLDGVIDEGEWKHAKEYRLKGEGKLLVRKNSSALFIAMIAEQNSWAHVYLANDDSIWVLHASAALGKAVYVKSKDFWRSHQDFHWEMRERIYNKEMEEQQELYYVNNGWVANNNNTGDGKTFEFRIDLKKSSLLSFACLVLNDPAQPHYFPDTLNDHTILPRLMQGFVPDSLKFNSASWEQLR